MAAASWCSCFAACRLNVLVDVWTNPIEILWEWPFTCEGLRKHLITFRTTVHVGHYVSSLNLVARPHHQVTTGRSVKLSQKINGLRSRFLIQMIKIWNSCVAADCLVVDITPSMFNVSQLLRFIYKVTQWNKQRWWEMISINEKGKTSQIKNDKHQLKTGESLNKTWNNMCCLNACEQMLLF